MTQPSPKAAGLDGLHVVVLDDLAASRVAASAMLSRMDVDHDVTDSEDRAAGLLRDALEADAHDLVLLLDESVAKQNAPEVARMMADDSPLRSTRIVLMSHHPESVNISAIPFPISTVVRKPLLRPETLAEALGKTPAAITSSRAPFEPGVGLQARQGPLVLVVDDDDISRSVSSQLLARLGCIVESVSRGAEAIALTQRTSFDLVFMDCQMPEMDGYMTTEKIRAAMGNKAPPIVALTANTNAQDRERCFSAGMCDFVSKPTRMSELARAVKAWIPKERFAEK